MNSLEDKYRLILKLEKELAKEIKEEIKKDLKKRKLNLYFYSHVNNKYSLSLKGGYPLSKLPIKIQKLIKLLKKDRRLCDKAFNFK